MCVVAIPLNSVDVTHPLGPNCKNSMASSTMIMDIEHNTLIPWNAMTFAFER